MPIARRSPPTSSRCRRSRGRRSRRRSEAHRASASGAAMNLFKAILLKVASALLFASMSSLVRYLGESVPLGQQVFFRSAFAIVPVVMIYVWRHELSAALHTARPLGHVGRGLI